jgi:hypothetical protein
MARGVGGTTVNSMTVGVVKFRTTGVAGTMLRMISDK